MPTDEQCELMEQFVQAMDLDEYAASGNTAGGAEGKEEGEEDDDEEMREEYAHCFRFLTSLVQF